MLFIIVVLVVVVVVVVIFSLLFCNRIFCFLLLATINFISMEVITIRLLRRCDDMTRIVMMMTRIVMI